jgi:hypothetical protein
MTPENVRAFLKLLNCKVPQVQTRGGWMVSSCPLGPY